MGETGNPSRRSLEARYARLIRLAGVGEMGLDRIRKARITLVGCGTLGGAYALNLVRMGVRHLRLIDRDIVEEQNLSTQILFDEDDVRQVLPKVVAAKRHLVVMNGDCDIQVYASDLNAKNAEALLQDADLILDATDNFETRFLINDAALKFNIPWIYTGFVGFTGLFLTVVPGRSACLRCLMEKPPEPGKLPTCETAGVWAPAAQAVVGAALTEALKLLTGGKLESSLTELDFQAGSWRRVMVERRKHCPACVSHDFPYLDGRKASQATRLCGRDMVHLTPERDVTLNLSELARELPSAFDVAVSEHLLRLRVPEAEIYLFPDGRAFVKGVSDPGRAKVIYSRYFST